MAMDKTEEAKLAMRDIQLAHREVYGMPGKRTKAQQIVWDFMVSHWKINKPSFMPNIHNIHGKGETKAEACYDPIKAAITDGAKLPYFQILEFIQKPLEPEPKKPTVKDGKQT